MKLLFLLGIIFFLATLVPAQIADSTTVPRTTESPFSPSPYPPPPTPSQRTGVHCKHRKEDGDGATTCPLHSVCNRHHECFCDLGFLWNSRTRECRPVEPCSQDSECRHLFPNTRCYPKYHRCFCDRHSRFNPESQSCAWNPRIVIELNALILGFGALIGLVLLTLVCCCCCRGWCCCRCCCKRRERIRYQPLSSPSNATAHTPMLPNNSNSPPPSYGSYQNYGYVNGPATQQQQHYPTAQLQQQAQAQNQS